MLVKWKRPVIKFLHWFCRTGMCEQLLTLPPTSSTGHFYNVTLEFSFISLEGKRFSTGEREQKISPKQNRACLERKAAPPKSNSQNSDILIALYGPRAELYCLLNGPDGRGHLRHGKEVRPLQNERQLGSFAFRYFFFSPGNVALLLFELFIVVFF